MKKLFLTLALILTLVFAFAACDGGDNGGNTPGGDTPPHTHAFDQKNVGDAYLKSNANETSPAEYYYSCKCGEKGTETFTFGNAIGGAGNGDEAHIFRTEWTSDNEKHWQSCLDLSCDVRKNEANHTFGEWVIDKEPTCVKEGTKHRTCAVCGKSLSETIPVNPTAHNYATTWTTDGKNHWHKCQNSGCTSVLEKAPHAWDEENTCTVCQRDKYDGVKFMKMSDGTYQVSGYTGSASEVIIPSVYNGIAVTSIGDYAFQSSRLTSITIPDSVTTIGDYAFYNCYSLTSITFGENSKLTSIGNFAFRGCSGLTSITFGENNQLTTIGDYAFYNCYSLTSITIPDSVTSIGDSAFEDCKSLTSITIPDGVTTIGDYAFRGCSNLTSITVEKGNTVYHSAGNCLIETKSKTLIAGCKNSVIPTNGSVTTIGDGAFYYCNFLTSITIPSSVTTIGDYAFQGSGLTSIIFGGTKAQWERVSKGSDWAYNTPDITVTCTDGVYSTTY